MPSGKVHDQLTFLITPPLWVLFSTEFHYSNMICLLVTSGTLVGGLLLSPDLDIKSTPFYRWGIIRFIWWPYQKIAKHRSELSHGWLFASWIRFAYILLIAAGAYCLVTNTPIIEVWDYVKLHYMYFVWFGIGIWIGCLLHIVADHVVSGFKH